MESKEADFPLSSVTSVDQGRTEVMATYSMKKWISKIELQSASNRASLLVNRDLFPVPIKNRIWGSWTYSLFWFGECLSVTSWTVASTGVTQGLSWWESWLCVIIGHLIVAFPMVATGRPGAVYHVPFPVISRASFGVWGSYWPIINRDIMTVIWCGVQMVTTGNCIYVMLHAIFPSIAHVHNPFSSDVSITGGRLIGFAVAWTICLITTIVPVHRLRTLVMVKSGLMFICLFTFFGWAISRAHGIGPIIHQGAEIPKGSSHAWVFLSNLFVQAANMATFATNDADLTRYARRPKDATLPQLICMPIAYGTVAFFGIFITSASKTLFGKVIWDPTQILDGFLNKNYDSHTRAGVFFIALGFAFAQVGTVILANLIQGGNDTAAILPRFVNIRRGMIIILVLCFAITPWNLTKTSFSFTSYLGSYQIFMGSIIGVVIGDYFLVRKGFYDARALFSANKEDIYYYTRGWNWRAYVAYIVGIVPVFPGFLHSVGVKNIPIGAQRLYIFALPVGILVAAVCYWAICLWSPLPGGNAKQWLEVETKDEFIIEGAEVESGSGGSVEETTMADLKA